MMTAILLLSFAACGNGASVNDTAKDTAKILTEQVTEPTVASIGGEWTVIGLARSGADVPERYFDTYYDNVRSIVKEKKGVLDDSHYTEYARVSMALAAIGKDASNVEGYNLLKPLDDYKAVTEQGLNGAAYALLAAHVNGYQLKNEEKYVGYILDQECEEGGFSYNSSDSTASADMTAIAIQALSIYSEQADVKEAMDKAVEVLEELQDEEGLFAESGFDPSSESISQVIIALNSVGIDINEQFVKNEKSLYDVLLQFQCENGFCHVVGDGGNLLATEQAMCALASLELMEEGSSFYAF